MRNTPLWRPQALSESEIADLPTDATSRGVSALAIVAIGLTLAAGVGAIGVFAFTGAGNSEAPATAAATPVVTAQPAVGATTTRLPEVATRAPLPQAGNTFAEAPAKPGQDTTEPQPVETIDVAIAESEFDIARLEEMTGMLEPAQPAVEQVAEQPLPEQGRVTAVIGGDSPAVTASPEAPLASPDIGQPAEADSPPGAPDERTQTASIQPDQPAAEAANPEPAAPALPPMRAAKVNRYVNMRSGPADESGVIIVVPAGATVQAQADCGWCVVTYKGQRGYIYKSFLRGGGGGSASISKQSKPGLF